MKTPHVLTFLLPLLLPLALSYTSPEDDLVFDDVGEDTSTVSSSTTIIHRHIKKKEDRKANVNRKYQVEKLQSIQNLVATVGHVFKFQIPKETFSGSTNHYEIQGKNGLPGWLSWDEETSTLSGIPGKEDIDSYRLRIKAFGEFGGSAKDTFTIRVQPKIPKSKCIEGQNLMEIKLGVEFESLPPKNKTEAIETFARYLGLPKNSIFLNSSGKHGTKIQWEVGCDGQLWEEQVSIMKRIPKEIKDGTLEEVLQIPVLGWRVRSDSYSRNRRDVGSGDFENPEDYEDNYDDYGEDYEEEDDDEDTESLTESSLSQPYVPGKNKHRHHHGEETIDWNMEDVDEHDIVPIVDQNVLGSKPNISTLSVPSALPSTVVPTEQPGVSSTRLASGTINTTTSTTPSSTFVPSTSVAHTTTTNFTDEPIIFNANYTSTTTNVGNFTTGYPTTSITTNTPSTATVVPTTVPTTISSTISSTISTPHSTASTSIGSTTTITVSTTTPSTTTFKSTTVPVTTTLPPRITTEHFEYGIHNSPPRQDRRLKKIPVTAGKPLSYIIPSDTFSDAEDGNTRKLKLSIYLQGAPLKTNHWLQFNPHTQEIYGLPLESEISTWDYELVASDSEGLNVSDRLDIHVQQHKSSRTVNHEFSIYLKIDKRSEFPSDVDWKLKVVRDLASLYDDNDIRHITVRSIDTENDQAIFTWTNDSIPRSSECPKEQINALLRVLTDDRGEVPSDTLVRLFAPEIKVKRVLYRGFGQCEDTIGPEPPKVSTQRPKVNFPPIPRNQVDHINATVGQLLVFKVPEDTFFDHEDGSSRNMKMDLFTMDRTPIPSNEWLKFDTKNQEFYGIPMENDIGRKEYQLIVTDKDGATATDGLVVIVSPPPVMRHTVEFCATLLIPYETFVNSASLKRSFVEKLQQLYQDKDTSAISLHSMSEGSTIVVWHNITLPTTYCAHDEIDRLQSILVNSRTRGVVDRVHRIMGDQFPVNQVSVVPMGICADEMVGVHFPDNHVPPVDDSTSVGAFQENYLVTIILPTIIIATMLILAGIIACVLYKRRRSGKMSVSEQDDERQSFRSKGIPVIFQDELDEKPDPGNKSPVILKEEKPPLPPPEYQKTEDGADVPMLPKENSEEPYQPPPPFATNRDTNRQNRPKPTPTYRKPPPYVPP